MELLSCPAQRGAVLWQGLLLTALLLTFWSPPSTAEFRPVSAEVVPPNALRGKQALLIPHARSEKYISLNWYRKDWNPNNLIAMLVDNAEKMMKGLQHRTRHTLYSNGSLLIRNLKKADEGIYKLRVLTLQYDYEYAEVELRVYEPMKKPIISYASVVLKCAPDVPGVPIRWYLNDEELQPETTRRLSSDNQTLILNPVGLWDEGDFQCAVYNPASSFRSAHIRLKVTKP